MLKLWLRRLLPLGIAASIIIALLALGHSLSYKANEADGFQNVRGAYSLARHGVIAFEGGQGDGYAPGQYREPLPIAALALQIILDPRIGDDATINSLNRGKHLLYLKQHNLIWALLCLLGVALTAILMVPERIAGQISAIVAIFLVYAFFLNNDGIIDRNYTEIQAATLMVWLGVATVLGMKRGQKKFFVMAGVFLGLLALTKASYAYVALGFILAMGAWHLMFPSTVKRWSETLSIVLCLFVAMAAVTLPWLIRNKIHFDVYTIAQRGGAVLYNRALQDQMTDEEFRSVLINWSPYPWRTKLIKHLGYSQKEFREGPVRRFNRNASPYSKSDRVAVSEGRPEDAVTYRMQARAERTRLRHLYRDQGFENAASLADTEQRREAIDLIVAHPGAHMKASAAFLWRGSWMLRSDLFNSNVTSILNAAALLSLLTLFVWGAVGGYRAAFGATLFPIGCFAFYALATHFITRYSTPMVPSMMLSLVVLSAISIRRVAMLRATRSRLSCDAYPSQS